MRAAPTKFFVSLFRLSALTNREYIASAVTVDDVIKYCDSEQLSRFRQSVGDLVIFLARRRISRRMIMRQHHRRRPLDERGLEHFAGMNQRGVKRSDRY